MKRPLLATIYAWLLILGSILLLAQGYDRFTTKAQLPIIAASLFQGLIMLATGLAILKNHSHAVGLVRTTTILFGLASLAAGLSPLDILLTLLLIGFAVWYGKQVKTKSVSSQPSN